MLILLFLFACENKKPKTQAKYYDIINIKNVPKAEKDWKSFAHFDMGAWFGFALPVDTIPGSYHGFSGPFVHLEKKWVSPAFLRVHLSESKKEYKAEDAKNAARYEPGKLFIQSEWPELKVEQSLIFISNKTVQIKVFVKNISEKDKTISLALKGSLFAEKVKIENTENAIVVNGKSYKLALWKTIDGQFDLQGRSYRFGLSEPYEMKAGKSQTIFLYLSVVAGDEDLEKETKGFVSEEPGKFVSDNELRWTSYLEKVLNKETRNNDLRVKSLITLINNWRSAGGDLKYDGIIPSYAISYFDGFWAWDSWKHAVAVVEFEPELAKNQVRTMFAYQDKHGMVADVIYRKKAENNWRDTKPPLSVWAVWAIYQKTNDLAFLEEMFPKLMKYHEWWYKNRDNDQNGLCEYGSTDGTRIAAAWESGMDNAVRFDDAVMVKNNSSAWSINQESVDLNSYLYTEKKYLAKLTTVLKKKELSARFQKEAGILKEKINRLMFDDETGSYFDIRLETKKKIKIHGPESWTALWAGVAEKKHAEAILKHILDEKKFNSFVPFPTLDISHKKLMPVKGYWRGPVWLDQVYFGLSGLKNYGFNKEADQLFQKLLSNAEGLSNSDLPIRENYNPLTGKGLNVNHFSWSAAHLLMLLNNFPH